MGLNENHWTIRNISKQQLPPMDVHPCQKTPMFLPLQTLPPIPTFEKEKGFGFYEILLSFSFGALLISFTFGSDYGDNDIVLLGKGIETSSIDIINCEHT
ncbi:hypothetical protein STEG23_024622 [Scotinomys teguina]